MVAQDNRIGIYLVSRGSDLVGLLDDREYAAVMTAVGVYSELIVMPKRPAVVMTTLFFALGAEPDDFEGIHEM